MTKTVACLAGDGVGPELMAAATRALERVAKLHQLRLDDRHLPFAGEAVTRSGHPLPADTRAAYREADAILVAAPHEPAFDGVKADLQLSWRAVRVEVGAEEDLIVTGPVDEWATTTALTGFWPLQTREVLTDTYISRRSLVYPLYSAGSGRDSPASTRPILSALPSPCLFRDRDRSERSDDQGEVCAPPRHRRPNPPTACFRCRSP